MGFYGVQETLEWISPDCESEVLLIDDFIKQNLDCIMPSIEPKNIE
jgi:hypothetical protein